MSLFLWLIVPIGANAAAVVGSLAPAIQSSTFDSYQLAILSAHGDRLHNAGKEQFTMTGVLSQGKAFVPFTVVRQLPNTLKLVKDGAVLSYDGKPAAASVSVLDDDTRALFDSLFLDTPDSFFAYRTLGGGVRLLAGRARTDDGKTKNYKGPYYTIYQATFPADALGAKGLVTKNFIFDNATGLLSEVRSVFQRGNAKVTVSTVYSGWRTIFGQSVPTSITRSEGGVLLWTFQANTASVTVANAGLLAAQ